MTEGVSTETIALPGVIMEDWLPHLSPLRFKVVTLLAARGHHDPPGYPREDRWQLADALGAERGHCYQALKALVALGVLTDVDGCWTVNLDWDPNRAPWDVVDPPGRREPSGHRKRKEP